MGRQVAPQSNWPTRMRRSRSAFWLPRLGRADEVIE
jgi:hypothetical protein